MSRRLLFVCTGNTCRSPMAKALLRASICASSSTETIEIESAGTSACPGDSATGLAIHAMKRRGIDLSDHRAAPLSRDVVDRADIVLTMTREHQDSVLRRFPFAAGKVFTVCDYAGIAGDIVDPMPRGTEQAYEDCARQLAELMPRVLRCFSGVQAS